MKFAKSKTYKVVFADKDNIFVVRRGKTSADKVQKDDTPIIQTYTFSREQYRLANLPTGSITMDQFFAADGPNCMDCPFSANQNKGKAGKCYTHKYMQYSGFLSTLRSIKPEQLTPLTEEKHQLILNMTSGLYCRFGMYGEPSLLPFDLVTDMAAVAVNPTGYTHQSTKPWAQKFAKVFRASTHGKGQAGWVSFSVVNSIDEHPDAILCPASKEGGEKSHCAKCGLCSGTDGKGKKVDVKIVMH